MTIANQIFTGEILFWGGKGTKTRMASEAPVSGDRVHSLVDREAVRFRRNTPLRKVA
jgi:hypothetical protein